MRQKASTLDSLILDEASEWFVEFRAGDVNAQAREQFDEWLRRSPGHIQAYMEIARAYVEAPPPAHALSKANVAAMIADANNASNVVLLTERTRPVAPLIRTAVTPTGRRSLWGRGQVLAASIVAALAVSGGFLVWQSARYPSYATEIGERRSLQLSDGSTVDLNARSRLRVEFSGTERCVALLEGQALFQVAKDNARPFIVKSADATVQAVGTQFDVDQKSSGTTVTVLDGRVVVYPSKGQAPVDDPAGNIPSKANDISTQALIPSATTSPTTGGAPSLKTSAAQSEGSSSALVSAGQQVIVTARSLRASDHADVSAATAWKQRKLIFEGARLADVVEAFNRNSRRQLVIESGALSDYHVSGRYSSADPSGLIRFLRAQPGFKITETGDGVHIAAQ